MRLWQMTLRVSFRLHHAAKRNILPTNRLVVSHIVEAHLAFFFSSASCCCASILTTVGYFFEGDLFPGDFLPPAGLLALTGDFFGCLAFFIFAFSESRSRSCELHSSSPGPIGIRYGGCAESLRS